MLWLLESFFKVLQRRCDFFKTVSLVAQATRHAAKKITEKMHDYFKQGKQSVVLLYHLCKSGNMYSVCTGNVTSSKLKCLWKQRSLNFQLQPA